MDIDHGAGRFVGIAQATTRLIIQWGRHTPPPIGRRLKIFQKSLRDEERSGDDGSLLSIDEARNLAKKGESAHSRVQMSSGPVGPGGRTQQ